MRRQCCRLPLSRPCCVRSSCGPFAEPFDITATDLLRLFLFGTTVSLGLVFLVIGGRLVSATENALINTLELPLAVAWGWVCFNEMPTSASYVGGVIVLAAVAAHVWHSSRSQVVSAAD
jgi:drug/metabolite transporter (DMT)-like permease